MGKTEFEINTRRLEIEITSECNLSCFGCNRSCQQAPISLHMTIDQVKKFINQSLQADWTWNIISLLGGEPSLHPRILEVLECLKEYKKQRPCVVELVTNGFGKDVQAFIDTAPGWVQIYNTRKIGCNQDFSPYNVAPKDLDLPADTDYSVGCSVPEEFGMGLTTNGFYPCGPGASLDRIFGFDIGIKDLSEVTEKAMRNQMSTLCQYCGHFLSDGPSRGKDIPEGAEGKTQTKSWQEAYLNSITSPPKMSNY